MSELDREHPVVETLGKNLAILRECQKTTTKQRQGIRTKETYYVLGAPGTGKEYDANEEMELEASNAAKRDKKRKASEAAESQVITSTSSDVPGDAGQSTASRGRRAKRSITSADGDGNESFGALNVMSQKLASKLHKGPSIARTKGKKRIITSDDEDEDDANGLAEVASKERSSKRHKDS
jgi:hypothetical protein